MNEYLVDHFFILLDNRNIFNEIIFFFFILIYLQGKSIGFGRNYDFPFSINL